MASRRSCPATTKAPIPSSSCSTPWPGCLTTTLVLHAAARGITIEALSTELDGDLDVRGLLGLDETVSPGYERIQIRMTVKANCPDEQLDELLAYTQQHSPVCNTVCQPVPVMIERVSG